MKSGVNAEISKDVMINLKTELGKKFGFVAVVLYMKNKGLSVNVPPKKDPSRIFMKKEKIYILNCQLSVQ